MSRIFDALRRSGAEQTPTTFSRAPGEDASWRDLVESIEAKPANSENMGRVQCRFDPESHIVAHTGKQDPGAEKFRLLAHRLLQLRQRRPLSRVLVASPSPKDGKTVVAVNLAATLARTPARVALIDADMRQPGVGRALGIRAMPGLADYLEGRIELAAAFKVAEPLRVYYVPAGQGSGDPVDLLQNSRMDELMIYATETFDWVIFDSPPLHPFADAQHLASITDGVLLVARAEKTQRRALKQSLASLDGAHLVGVVFNACGEARSDRYYPYRKSPAGKD
ncbi:MAG: CpsD/CapB family tyrosine-protein kinase [Terriglobia bacterium]